MTEPVPHLPGERDAGRRLDAVRSDPSRLNAANALTLLRVALVPVIGWLLVIEGDTARWWAVGAYVLAALTDTVDGWVARRRGGGGVTRWGQMADPLADKVLVVGVLVILAVIGQAPWPAVVLIAAREVVVSTQRRVLLRRGVVMPASLLGKVKTNVQMVATLLLLLPGVPAAVGLWALWGAVVITVASGVEYAFRGRRLLADRPDPEEADR